MEYLTILVCFNPSKTEEKKKKTTKEGGGSERHYMWGEGQENIISVWKVPRQCPLVLLVWVTCTFFY
jgi:hypothetical protein